MSTCSDAIEEEAVPAMQNALQIRKQQQQPHCMNIARMYVARDHANHTPDARGFVMPAFPGAPFVQVVDFKNHTATFIPEDNFPPMWHSLCCKEGSDTEKDSAHIAKVHDMMNAWQKMPEALQIIGSDKCGPFHCTHIYFFE